VLLQLQRLWNNFSDNFSWILARALLLKHLAFYVESLKTTTLQKLESVYASQWLDQIGNIIL